MPSSNNTLVGRGGSITDAAGNVWTITAQGQVAVNGRVDQTTRNVTHLAYANGLVWQENTANLWWSKTSPAAAWSPPAGTKAVPVPVPDAAPDDSVLGVVTNGLPQPSLTDSHGNVWTIVNGQVSVNGVIDPTTAHVTELAWKGGRIWQENAQHLWWSKAAPSDSWTPGSGTRTNPVTGNFWVANGALNAATIEVGRLTVSPEGGSGTPPGALARIITPGVSADGTAVHVSSQGTTLVTTGDSRLAHGADLTLIGAYRTPRPIYGGLENDGVMTIDGSTLHVGAVSGAGTINAANHSTLTVQSASGGETIRLQASHLDIGGQGGGPSGPGQPGGMSFLAPIRMDTASSITLEATHATSETLLKAAGSVAEVLLYDGATEVAHLTVHGVPNLYATNLGSGAGMAVLLSATPAANDLPLTIRPG